MQNAALVLGVAGIKVRISTSILFSLLLLSAGARESKDFAVTMAAGAEIRARLEAARRLGPEERENACRRLLEGLDTRFSTQEGADTLASERYRDQKARDEGKVNAIAEDAIETIRAKKRPHQSPVPTRGNGT